MTVDSIVVRPKLKIAILGLAKTGKSAIVVRYLTRRYISEYSSSNDFLYKHKINLDDGTQADIEILDTSKCEDYQCLFEHITWANAFIIVYSVCDKTSFIYARQLLETIHIIKSSHNFQIILLANKIDLSEHAIQISSNSGQELSIKFNNCPFYEVSAAENYIKITMAVQCLIRNSLYLLVKQPASNNNAAEGRPKQSPTLKMSRMFGLMLKKMGKNAPKKKQKSLSI